MNEAVSVYTAGVIATIEQFTLIDESLRQFVIYTYYNKEGEPLYIGCSKAFYSCHYLNAGRLSFFEDVEYVGFVFFDNEADMKDARKYFIKAREPKYNQRKCKSMQTLPGLDPAADDLVVSRKEMEQRWDEWLSPAEIDPEKEAEKRLIDTMVKRLEEKKDPEGLCNAAAAMIRHLHDRLEFTETVLGLCPDKKQG